MEKYWYLNKILQFKLKKINSQKLKLKDAVENTSDFENFTLIIISSENLFPKTNIIMFHRKF